MVRAARSVNAARKNGALAYVHAGAGNSSHEPVVPYGHTVSQEPASA